MAKLQLPAVITIHPQYLTPSKLLDGRLIRIPECQRAYSWTARQRQDLFGEPSLSGVRHELTEFDTCA